MELSREHPPAYVAHDPDDIKLPSVPTSKVRSHQTPSNVTLPNLQSVLAGLPEHRDYRYSDPSSHAQASPLSNDLSYRARHEAFRASSQGDSQAIPGSSAESALVSPSDTASVMSYDAHGRRSTSIVSLEDPDVRLAAEALSGLGNPGFVRANPQSHATDATTRSPTNSQASQAAGVEPEPLLNLLVDAHPWVGGTINGSLSAYTTTKSYSPRFVQYSANLIERNIGYPVVNTVSNVGRRTGVEYGIRRYLGGRRPSDLERADIESQQSKRRRLREEGDTMDIDGQAESAVTDSVTSPRDSQEFLPAYRSSKPPSYREESSPSSAERQQLRTRPPHDRSWTTRVMISTSGLSVALSDAALRNLTYCVQILAKANTHIESVVSALKLLLRDYETAQETRQREAARRAKEVEAGLLTRQQLEHDEAARHLADRIKQLCDDIWNTIKEVVNSVSTYAGGALPENARHIVKSQLLSIPQRWKSASATVAQTGLQTSAEQQSSPGELRPKQGLNDGAVIRAEGEVEVSNAAYRMIAFADEGLDMIAQVNGVVKITLQSAEDWLNSFPGGRRSRREGQMLDEDGQAARGAAQ